MSKDLAMNVFDPSVSDRRSKAFQCLTTSRLLDPPEVRRSGLTALGFWLGRTLGPFGSGLFDGIREYQSRSYPWRNKKFQSVSTPENLAALNLPPSFEGHCFYTSPAPSTPDDLPGPNTIY